jgi:uncharacterized protein YbaP (TraB family)
VSSEQGSLHLLGSVHAVTPDFYPLSEAIEAAYEKSEVVLFEVDLSKMPEAAVQLMTSGQLPDDTKLSDVLSPELYRLTEQRFESVGMDLSFFSKMEPWFLALTLSALELQKAGFSADLGIDRHLHQRALEDGKQLGELESIEYQVNLFEDLVGEKGEDFLRYTLEDLENMMPILEEISVAWMQGDAAGLGEMLTEAFADHPELYESMVNERNHLWLPKIEEVLEHGKHGLVVVGSLHLVGEEGLVELLRSKGYAVEQE